MLPAMPMAHCARAAGGDQRRSAQRL